jgi:hypothetical protein
MRQPSNSLAGLPGSDVIARRPENLGCGAISAARSAKQIAGKLFVHGETKSKSYEHQNSYADKDVLASLLYSVVQIAKTAKWEAS